MPPVEWRRAAGFGPTLAVLFRRLYVAASVGDDASSDTSQKPSAVHTGRSGDRVGHRAPMGGVAHAVAKHGSFAEFDAIVLLSISGPRHRAGEAKPVPWI
jgi:hypothetical protein